MTVTLPYPPGVNALYRTVRGRPILSAKAREYRRSVGLRCAAAGMRLPALHDVEVTIYLYRRRRAGDVDGPIKLLLDSLQGLAFKNDAQVRDLHVHRRDDKNDPRVMVDVRPAKVPQ